jgi:hypothetical protein
MIKRSEILLKFDNSPRWIRNFMNNLKLAQNHCQNEKTFNKEIFSKNQNILNSLVEQTFTT